MWIRTFFFPEFGLLFPQNEPKSLVNLLILTSNSYRVFNLNQEIEKIFGQYIALISGHKFFINFARCFWFIQPWIERLINLDLELTNHCKIASRPKSQNNSEILARIFHVDFPHVSIQCLFSTSRIGRLGLGRILLGQILETDSLVPCPSLLKKNRILNITLENKWNIYFN